MQTQRSCRLSLAEQHPSPAAWISATNSLQRGCHCDTSSHEHILCLPRKAGKPFPVIPTGRSYLSRAIQAAGQTCGSAANSHDSPGQEGQEARGSQVHPKRPHKVGGHPVEVNEVAPVVHKVDHNDSPGGFAGQQLQGAHLAC